MLTIISEREVCMKLARPDVFHPRIVLAGNSACTDDTADDDTGLIGALAHRGLQARWRCWDDPETLGADLVILRGAPGDVGGKFLAWARQVPNLLNPPEVVAWNAERAYLNDLRSAGVPTVTGHPPGPVVSLVFFGGGRSHAFAAPGVHSAAEPDFELWDLGRAALRAAAERLSIRIEELLYARADIIGSFADARLVGLDLIAPQFGWGTLSAAERDSGQRRFVLSVEAALQRLGLGPLSHRRP